MPSSQSPQPIVQSPRINRPRTKTQMTPKIDYRGITLKQYFRLYDQSLQYTTISQIKQQQPQSGVSSLAQTPTFGNIRRQNNRMKVKTEINEEESENYHKNQCQNYKNINISFDPCRKQAKKLKKNQNYPSTEKLNSSLLKKVYCLKKNQVKKNKKTNITTLPKEDQSRSTLHNFYKQKQTTQNQINSLNLVQNENTNKMLKKLKAQKQRNNEIKIQDIFYITKYANKFHINANELLT